MRFAAPNQTAHGVGGIAYRLVYKKKTSLSINSSWQKKNVGLMRCGIGIWLGKLVLRSLFADDLVRGAETVCPPRVFVLLFSCLMPVGAPRMFCGRAYSLQNIYVSSNCPYKPRACSMHSSCFPLIP